jgi:uncharacterized integral membrane protein (TIGR00698 family)
LIFRRNNTGSAAPLATAGDLFGELYLAERTVDRTAPARLAWRALVPGLVLCGLGSIAAAWFSEHYGMPIILMGLLIGLALAFAAQDERTHAGLDFASRTCLRLGIVILGTQVTFAQIGALGIVPFLALLAVMGSAFGAALLAARVFAQPQEAGLLAGGATAICGASAALALYGVIGKERLSQAQFALTLVGISLMSALAMSVYPVLAQQLGLNDRQAGFLIGASIHDVAQAIGGGYAFSDAAGSNATIVKLARVALLAPVVALVSLLFPAPQGAGGARPIWRRVALPWFIAAFLGVVALNSLIAVPVPVAHAGLTLSKTLLLLAVTATAMRSRMERLLEAGWQTFAPVLAATLASFAVALAFARLVV